MVKVVDDEVIFMDSEKEFEDEEPKEVGDDSDDDGYDGWNPSAITKTFIQRGCPAKRGRAARRTPGRRILRAKVADNDNEDEILSEYRAKSMSCKNKKAKVVDDKENDEILDEDSENEFEVGEPNEVGDDSDDDGGNFSPITKTSIKRGRPAKSTPSRRKKVKVSDEKEEKEIIAEDSANEIEGDEPEKVGDDSDDDGGNFSPIAKTSIKRGRPAKSTPSRRKKVKVSDEKEEKEIIAEDSANEIEGDEPEKVGDDSDDDGGNFSPIAKTSIKRGRPAKSTPNRRKKVKVSDEKEEKEIIAEDSANEVEGDEPEKVGDDSDDGNFSPIAKTSIKRRRSARSTPSTRKKVKVSDEKEEEEIIAEDSENEFGVDENEEAKTSIKRRRLARSTPSIRKKIKVSNEKKEEGIIAEDSENEFGVDKNEEVDSTDDGWNPCATKKISNKRGRPAKSMPDRRKKVKVSDAHDEEKRRAKSTPGKRKYIKVPDDEKGEKIGGENSKTPIPVAKRHGRAVKGKSKKGEDIDAVEGKTEDEEDMDEEEEELYQGPKDKPSKKFTSGAFVVLKTDMIGDKNPPVWKIESKMLQKYIPFEQNGNILYRNTRVYNSWSSNQKEKYHNVPVSFIYQTQNVHIIEVYKDKIKKNPKVKKAANKEVAAAEDDDDDDEGQ